MVGVMGVVAGRLSGGCGVIKIFCDVFFFFFFSVSNSVLNELLFLSRGYYSWSLLLIEHLGTD